MNKPDTGNIKVILLILIIVVTIMVLVMGDFHLSRDSPFQNEAFFGALDRPVPELSFSHAAKTDA